MSEVHDVAARLRQHLEGLSRTQCRPEFGNQVFYVGGTQFAALTDRAVLMHLPSTELTAALRRRHARPFVSAGAMGRNGWVEVQLTGVPEAELERLLTVSHAAASHAHRKSRPKHPGRARRRIPGTIK